MRSTQHPRSTPPLATSYFAGFKAEYGVAVRVSVGAPRWWKSDLPHIRRLSPYGLLAETNRAVFARRYLMKLADLDVDSLAERFAAISTDRSLVLCCWEADPAQCHRSLLARWLTANGFGPVSEAKPAQMTLEVEP